MLYKLSIIVSIAAGILLWTRLYRLDKALGDIKGRNVIITGASAGIGEELAYQYAKLGANVFITARRENLLKRVVQNCKSTNPNGKFGYYVGDMESYKMESKLLIEKAVLFLHGIDTLILNHVYFGHLVVWQGTAKQLEMFEKMSAINYNSYVHIVSHALPYLKSSTNGRLGVISSIVGKTPTVLGSAYCSNKFALDGFFSTLRDELAQAKINITVTLSVLGVIDTKNGQKFREDEAKRLGISLDMMINIADYATSTPLETAEKIMEGTETGVSELYHPYWFKSTTVTFPAAWIAIVRHIWPALTEVIIYSDTFYSNQESVQEN